LSGGKFTSAFVPTSEGLLVGMRTHVFA